MLFKGIFGKLSKSTIVKLIKKEGSLIGEREFDGRKIYIYILRDFFVQIMFRKDDPSDEVENLQTFSNLGQLNSHLEKEFKSAF